MDTIFIRDLTFDCIIGIYPSERTNAQPLIVNLEMATDITPAAKTGDLSLSLNYAEISEFIIAICTQRKAELIESLAEELVAELFERYPIPSLQLEISKPQAVEQAAGVGVRIARERPTS